MMSKKWAFSLTSLITILALAFVVTPAMAGDFSAAISVGGHDISHADGEQREAGAEIVFNVTFGQIVTSVPANAVATGEEFAAADLVMQAYDENNVIQTKPTATISAGLPADGKNYTITMTPDAAIRKLYLQIPQGKVGAADPTVGDDDDANAKAEITVTFLVEDGLADPDTAETGNATFGHATNGPDVLKIARVGEPFVIVTSAEFMVHVLLSEDAKGGLTKDLIDVGDNATVNSVLKLASPAGATMSDDAGLVSRTTEFDTAVRLDTLDTWRDGMLHLYLVTIGTKPGEKTVTVKVKNFAGMERPAPTVAQEMYNRDADSALVEGRDKLTVKTKTADPKTPKAAGVAFKVPKEKYIPGGGYLVLTVNKAGSSVHTPPGEIKEAPKPHERTVPEQKYNVVHDQTGLPNLETFLSNGGVIDVVGPQPLKITEIMWGSDASLKPASNSQWIELYNPGAGFATVDDDGATAAYESVTLIFYNPSELASLPALTAVHDRVGTVDAAGTYWSLAGKGQSGRSGKEEQAAALGAIVPTQSIISMYRVMDATGTVADGTVASSWMQSTPPSLNFDADAPGVHIGSPGAARLVTPAEIAAAAAAEKAKADAAAKAAADAAAKKAGTGTVPDAGAIYVSEIMVDRGNGLPQWLEISNGSRTEDVNLSGWTLTVNNAAADADVSVGGSITFTIPDGTMITRSGQNTIPSTLLVVTEMGRNDLGGLSADYVLNLWESGQTELILAGVTKRRYSLLSEMAFEVVLAPPAPTATKVAATATAAEKAAAKAADLKAKAAHAAATDMAGNLGADGAAAWALPMGEEGEARSSLIRAHVQVSVGPAEPEDGKMMTTWRRAADTAFAHPTHIRRANYYGAANDVGTPGFRTGGALPVELSHFRPARDKATGQAVITWSTQSELNNAGFFIKRSQQRNGEFKVINATMVPGAGTTSEKQFYTYTDTTAQPNVVYYYQIEDVSLDGNRQTLTRGIRLKGHVGAAGKATTLWGELKTSHE